MPLSGLLRPLRVLLLSLAIYLGFAVFLSDLHPWWRVPIPGASPANPPPDVHTILYASRAAWNGSRPFQDYTLSAGACFLLFVATLLAIARLPKPGSPAKPAKPLAQPSRAFRFACTASFICALLSASFWFRSTVAADFITFTTSTHDWELSSELGALHYDSGSASRPHARRVEYACVGNPANFHLLQADGSIFYPQYEWVRMPAAFRCSMGYAPLLATAMLLPLVWILRFGFPTWTTVFVAAVVGLWPLELSLLNGGGVIITFGVVVISAGIGVIVLAFRDRITHAVEERAKRNGRRSIDSSPWPWQFERKRMYHRLKHKLCLNCGYDLRASKEICPECGQPPLRRIGTVESHEAQRYPEG